MKIQKIKLFTGKEMGELENEVNNFVSEIGAEKVKSISIVEPDKPLCSILVVYESNEETPKIVNVD
jgi:hypothetical protein